MKNKIFSKKAIPYLIETALLFVLLFWKSMRVSLEIMKLEDFALPIVMFGICIFSVPALFVRLVCKRDHIPLFFGLYAVVSVALLVDAVYCGYTGKLPSVVMLRYTWQLGGVSGAIYENITFPRLLYALDLPIWIVYFTNFRKKVHTFFEANRRESRGASSVMLGAVGGIAAVVCTCYCIFTPFVPVYFENEILTYHVLDIVDAISGKGSGYELDADLLDEPSTPVDSEASPYFGIANGYNVITIQLEAFQNFVIGTYYEGQELTPNINALLETDTLYFDNYYYQIGGGNTADAEFAVNNSLYAPDTVAAYEVYRDNDYYSMPILLKENGYGSATAFHAYIAEYWYRNLAYPKQGFDAYLSGSDFYKDPYEVAGMGASDGSFFEMAVDYLSALEGDDPFYAFMVSLTSHYEFKIAKEFQMLTLKEEHIGTLFGNYLQCVRYVDSAIGQLIDALKEKGLYENTIITLYGDHFGLPVYDWQSKQLVTELLGKEYTYEQHFNVPLMMHIPGSALSETHSVTGGHVDVMPTLLHLLGLENGKGIMFGQNLLTAKEGIVYQQTHLARGSFISDTVFFEYPFSGIDLNAKANALGTWESLDAWHFLDTADEARKEIERCMYLLDNNLVLIDKYKEAVGK